MRFLDSARPVYLACAISLALGLFYTFIWSPLPWGWLGIDFYHDRAIRLAAGLPFDTTDVPWGYAYYLAFWYVLFGPIPWIPLVVQVVANAFVPFLLYQLARPLTNHRTAAAAALLTGVFSFNTVYAATQSSDSICTVLFLSSLLLYHRGRETGSLGMFVASGVLAGLAPQFRPNLILFPVLLAVLHVWRPPRARRRVVEAGAMLAMVVLALAPWTIRNYRLTHSFLPTSTHGGIQLWFGTLQTGKYLESRAYNPRSAFETASFDYTSLENLSIVVAATPVGCPVWRIAAIELIYWTDRNATHSAVPFHAVENGAFVFEIPGQPAPTAVYYYFRATWPPDAGGERTTLTPAGAESDPYVLFVSTDHLGDLDRHGDVVDVFDLARTLLSGRAAGIDGTVETAADSVTLRLRDQSRFTVPRSFSGRVTDLEVEGQLASELLYTRRAKSGRRGMDVASGASDPCRRLGQVDVNEVFHRKEPHMMRRYTALAWDNIRREPVAFAMASLYRVVRLFIIRGSSDRHTSQQFSGSDLIYPAAFAVSLLYFGVFVAGVFLAWRAGYRILLLLLPIIYVPLTICFVLTNMRYSVTVQPFMFVFVAVTVLTVLRRANVLTADVGAATTRNRV